MNNKSYGNPIIAVNTQSQSIIFDIYLLSHFYKRNY